MIGGLWCFSDTNEGERKKMEYTMFFDDTDDGIPFEISFKKRKILFNGIEGEKTSIEIKKGTQVLIIGEIPNDMIKSLQYFLKTNEF